MEDHRQTPKLPYNKSDHSPVVDFPELPTYLDEPEFLLYAQRIDMIIAAAGEIGVTTREIHSKLGERARREWTMDAIDSLHMIDQVGFLPTRYRKIGFFKRTRDPHPMIREGQAA